jgi:CDP-glucose 4,6-dehydratase
MAVVSPFSAPDLSFWWGRRVLLTGHTGFKGSWLALWLLELGARVTGLALPPDTEPNLFAQLGLDRRLDHRLGDV